MDPQKPVDLDPKLKEAYQRVMGTTAPQVPPVPPSQPQSQPQPQITQPIQPKISPAPSAPNATVFFEDKKKAPPTPAKPVTPLVVKPSRGGQSPLPLPLVILVLILFFLGYTFFWIKFFKLNLPFLPF